MLNTDQTKRLQNPTKPQPKTTLSRLSFSAKTAFAAISLTFSSVAMAFNPNACLNHFEGDSLKVCQAAINGDPEAQYQLARFYGDANNSNLIDYEQSFYWHRELARQALKKNLTDDAYLLTMHNTGVFYADGIGVERNLKNALFWFEKAAEKGEALSMVRLAMAYVDGQGRPQNRELGNKWIQKAVDKDLPQAKVLMSKWILESKLPNKDANYAIKILKEAKQAGSAQASFALGNMYLQGYQLEKNLVEAKKMFSHACSRMYLEACKRYHDIDTGSLQ